MQEFSRMYSDQNYYDVLEEGGQPEMPYIITVPKGKPPKFAFSGLERGRN